MKMPYTPVWAETKTSKPNWLEEKLKREDLQGNITLLIIILTIYFLFFFFGQSSNKASVSCPDYEYFAGNC